MIKFILKVDDHDTDELLVYPVYAASNYDELIQNLNKIHDQYDNIEIDEMDIVIEDTPPVKGVYANRMWLSQLITFVTDFKENKKVPFDEFINFYAYTAGLTGFAIKLENIEIYNTVEDYIDANLPLNPFQHMMDNDELCVFIPEHMPYYNYDIILRELDRAGNSFTLKDRRYIVFM